MIGDLLGYLVHVYSIQDGIYSTCSLGLSISVDTGQLIIHEPKAPIGIVRGIVGGSARAPLVLIKDNAEHKRLGIGDHGAEGGRTGGHAALALAAEAQGLPAKSLPKAAHSDVYRSLLKEKASR
jgi:hypothetical protein